MGTRNLTCAIKDGKYKIAQYGQWDGYPSGQGVTALEFLRDTDLDGFKERLNNVRFITEKESKAIDKKYGAEWKKHYPQMSRDRGAEILKLVMDGANELQNNIDFAEEGLMCEWSYIVDFDSDTFEAYDGGFDVDNRKPIAKWNLSELPTNEQFLSILESSEED